jgi:D-alanyl-lipoteichoic acid acyltransferase DltB (MBOAT superfamily)
MLFNSYAFIFGFLPIFLTVLFLVARWQPQCVVPALVAASLLFYAYWDVRYLLLLAASVTVNFSLARLMILPGGSRGRRTLLTLGLVLNLGGLFFFKYFDFFSRTVNAVSPAHWPILGLVLPLGISFFTFTQIAFLVDTYRGEVTVVRWLDYVLFVTYFPHLIAGPILHHKEMMPQFAAARHMRLRTSEIAAGLAMFTIGLAKKVLLADSFARYATPVFAAASAGAHPRMVAAWSGALAYTLQLYFDFSGYCDMAVGISKAIGIRLPANFNSPYQAASLIDFWRRWHITLSRFLRDYLYIPLGGNRRGLVRRHLNLFATMLLGGLWHGANWTFVIWGALHGAGLIVNHAWRAFTPRARWAAHAAVRCFNWTLTMLTVVTAWVIFRADSLGTAARILRGMAGANGLTLPMRIGVWDRALGGFLSRHGIGFTGSFLLANESGNNSPDTYARQFFCYLILAGLLLLGPNSNQILEYYTPVLNPPPAGRAIKLDRLWGVSAGLLFATCLLFMGRKSEFLYFQF